MMKKPLNNRAKSQSGNIFFMLFASVALVGAFGVGASNVMKGLVSTMSDVTRKTIAEEKMTAGARLAIQNATATQGVAGDCDGDPLTGIDILVEPLPFRSAGTLPHPQGGGYLPLEIGATLADPWGTAFGYCAWDPGTLRDNAGCGGPGANRRIGIGVNNQDTAGLVVAVISAGKDRRFTTTCNDFVDVAPADGNPDTPMIGRASGGDDIIFEYTYAEANGLSGDDLWRVQDTKPNTAMIDKDVEIAGDASMEGVLELRRRGLLLPDDTETGACTALNESELRVNTSSSPPILEICYDTVWEPISMSGGGGGGAGGACGTSWDLQTAPNRTWSDIAFGNNVFVAVADSTTNSAMTSPDGITWTQRTTPVSSKAVAFGAGIFVGAGNGGNIITSPDGITWTQRTNPETFNITSITYGNGLFVAVGNSTAVALTSPDGITWTQRTLPRSDNWRGVTYGNNLFLAATVFAGSAYSSDGISWTLSTTGEIYNQGIAFGAGLFVTARASIAETTANGTSWSTNSTGLSDTEGVSFANGRFFVLDDAEVAISEDGLTWNISALPQTNVWRQVAYGNGKFVAVSENGTNRVITSDCDAFTEPEVVITPVPDPLVHLRLDEQTGTAVSDRMNNVTATLAGATNPPTVTGMLGRAYDLDGTDDRVTITGNSTINNINQFTASFWVYNTANGAAQTLLDTRNAGSNGMTFTRNNPSLTATLAIGTGGSFTTTETLPNNVWTHVAVTYDGSNLTQAPVIYLNGVAATYSSSTLPSAFTRPAGNWSIGRTLGGTSPNPGIFDDFKIFGQALTADQITSLYNDRSSTAYVSPNPLAIVAAGKYRGKITANDSMACGIKEDGSAWCWGDETTGSLGNGANAASVSPSRVETQTGENNFSQISMGDDFGCGIKGDRSAWCWGTDAAGQLGNGVTAGTQVNPTLVSGGAFWTQISAGGAHACGIQSNGQIYCWGDNPSGQLGITSGTPTSPVAISELGPWVYVAAGASTTCGIKTDGSAWCWGSSQYGRVGNGSTATASVTEAVPVLEAGPWVKISRGGTHTCGIKLDGSAWCWGSMTSGKLGNGTTTGNTGKPQRVTNAGPWLDIETSQNDATSCGIKYDGTMWCWGTDASGQLGNGTPTADQTMPSRVTDPGPWASVSLGMNVTCGIKADGSAWCWGADTNGRLGNGAAITGTQETPTRVENFPNVAPFAFNDAQTLLTKNTAATTISLGQDGGRIGFDGNSGGFGFTGSGRSFLSNPNGNSGLSLDASGAFDSQVSWKTVTGATTRSIGVDSVTGNLEFGNNIAAVTNFMSAITPQMIINSSRQIGLGTATPGVKFDISGGGLRIGDDTRTCTLSRKGVLRYNTNVIQYCNGAAWANF